MTNSWRDEIPLDQAIIAAVRYRVGTDIKEWAESIGVNRALLYQAAKGDGTRRSRVALATVLKQLPSELWPNRTYKVRTRDDEIYEAEIKREIIEQEAQQ